MVALQIVHPSAKDRPFGGTSHTFPILVGDLLEIRNNRYAFLPGRSVGICSAFYHFSLYVPLAVIAILPIEPLELADCNPAKPAVAIAVFALNPSTNLM